jgi:HAD superfamily hydrolase (TIGR01509 family)
MPAILFGSIGTIADTSELQRQAFNDAFRVHGLDWSWPREDYAAMLEKSSGKDRIAAYASSLGQEVDAGAIHGTKSELFQKSLDDNQLTPRPGVTDTIQQARSKGYKVALVTTTSSANVSSMINAMAPNITADDLDLVIDASQVEAPKPDKAAYVLALHELEVSPSECIAIEDNLGGVASATAAGIDCLAFPNQNTSGHHFTSAVGTVDRVNFSQLEGLL